MKRTMVIVTILLLALGLLGATSVAASTEYDSTINIRNMENETANVVIQFYNLAGDHLATADVALQIPPQTMAYYFVLQNDNLPVDFRGSAVVASDRELVIVHNLRINLGEQGASTSGFDQGAAVVQLPLIMRNNGGYTTWFSVQNAGMAAAEVRVEFFAGADWGNDWVWVNPADQTNTVTIQPGAAYYFHQADMPQLGERFVGSAIVTALNDQPLVSSVIQEGPAGLFAYDGFTTSGSATVTVPLFQYYNAGYQSSVQVQNVGDTATQVTLTYMPGPGLAGNACTETHMIEADASEIFGFFSFIQDTAYSDCYTQNPGTPFVGSVFVSANTANQPLMGVVNQMNSATIKSGAYNAFDPAEATACIAAPIIMDNNSNYWTSLQIMNIGAEATTVTVEYSEYQGHTPSDDVLTLQPNEMGALLHLDQLGPAPGQTYIGSALACATGNAPIVGVVNQFNALAAGDTLFVYNAFNVPN